MMEQWEMPEWIVTRNRKTRLLGTSPFWSSLSQPLGRPPTDLYSKTQGYSSGCQCAAGRCITSILPTFLHLLQTSAQTSFPVEGLLGVLWPWPFTPVPTSPDLVVLSKVFFLFQWAAKLGSTEALPQHHIQSCENA